MGFLKTTLPRIGYAACLALAAYAPKAGAAVSTWKATTAGSGQVWGTAGNWSGGVPGVGDTALFNGQNLPSGGAVGIKLKNAATLTLDAISLTASSGNLTLGNSETTGNGAGPNDLILNGTTLNSVANAILSNATTAATTLTIQDSVLGGGWHMNLALGTASSVIQATPGNSIVIASNIKQTVSNSSLTFQGGGTLVLGGTNSFGGVLTIQAGTLTIEVINNAGTSGALGNSNNAVVLGSSGAAGILNYTGASASSTKTFTLAAGGTGGFTVNTANANLTLNGVIGGGGALVKSGPGTLTLGVANLYSGGTTIVAGSLVGGHDAAFGTGTVAIGGGTLASSGARTFGNDLSVSGSGSKVDTAGGNMVLMGAINGSAALTKTGAGSLELKGASPGFSGLLTASAGTLLVSGSLGGAVTVQTNAVLGGGGSISGAVTVENGATVSPGNGSGILSTGNFSTAGGAHLSMEIGGSTAGINTDGTDGYDRVAAIGALDLASGTVFDISLLGLYNPPVASTYDIVTATGGFGSTDPGALVFNYPALPDGKSFTANVVQFGGSTILQLQIVPEPETWAMLLCGVGVLIGWNRDRRATA